MIVNSYQVLNNGSRSLKNVYAKWHLTRFNGKFLNPKLRYQKTQRAVMHGSVAGKGVLGA